MPLGTYTAMLRVNDSYLPLTQKDREAIVLWLRELAKEYELAELDTSALVVLEGRRPPMPRTCMDTESEKRRDVYRL